MTLLDHLTGIIQAFMEEAFKPFKFSTISFFETIKVLMVPIDFNLILSIHSGILTYHFVLK